MFKQGDYVYVKRLGLFAEEISYISIVKEYDEEERTLYEIASIWALDTLPEEGYEILYYGYKTDNIVEIRLATEEEKQYLDKNMAETDSIIFDKETLTLKDII